MFSVLTFSVFNFAICSEAFYVDSLLHDRFSWRFRDHIFRILKLFSVFCRYPNMFSNVELQFVRVLHLIMIIHHTWIRSRLFYGTRSNSFVDVTVEPYVILLVYDVHRNDFEAAFKFLSLDYICVSPFISNIWLHQFACIVSNFGRNTRFCSQTKSEKGRLRQWQIPTAGTIYNR